MGIVLGLDVGTSGTKAIAMDETGTLLASALVEYPLHSPKPGWAEQDPADWKRAAFEALAALAAKVNPAEVKGLGLTGQMHGSVFLDANGVLPRSIMPDLLHLSEEGYQRWADAIEPRIADLLAGKESAIRPGTAGLSGLFWESFLQ